MVLTVLKTEAEKAEEGEGVAVLVVSPAIRPWLSKMLRRVVADLTVLSFTELPDDQKITVLKAVSINRNGKEETNTYENSER